MKHWYFYRTSASQAPKMLINTCGFLHKICVGLACVPLTRYVKLRDTHALRTPGTVFPPSWVSDPDMHHGACVMNVPWCMPGSLTSGFLWSRWRGKRSRHSRRMCNPQFCVSGKRRMVSYKWNPTSDIRYHVFANRFYEIWTRIWISWNLKMKTNFMKQILSEPKSKR